MPYLLLGDGVVYRYRLLPVTLFLGAYPNEGARVFSFQALVSTSCRTILFGYHSRQNPFFLDPIPRNSFERSVLALSSWPSPWFSTFRKMDNSLSLFLGANSNKGTMSVRLYYRSKPWSLPVPPIDSAFSLAVTPYLLLCDGVMYRYLLPVTGYPFSWGLSSRRGQGILVPSLGLYLLKEGKFSLAVTSYLLLGDGVMYRYRLLPVPLFLGAYPNERARCYSRSKPWSLPPVKGDNSLWLP
jgi:hypothetical protein